MITFYHRNTCIIIF